MARRTPTALVRFAAGAGTAALLLLGFGVAPASAAVVTISGTVTVDGVPTAGVTVTDGILTAVSDTTGHYEFLDGTNGFHFIGVDDPGNLYQDFFAFANITEATPTAIVNVPLLGTGPATGIVTGTVTVDGVPAEGVLVQALSFSPGTIPNDETDADGNFEITGLGYGSYTIDVFDFDDNYQLLFGNTVVISSTVQEVEKDLALATWVFGTGSVTGFVTDADTGSAIEGANVNFSASGVRPQTTSTDADGYYEFLDIPETTGQVTVFATGYVTEFQSFPILDGEIVPVDFELAPTNATIHGFVRDAEGNGISGVSVRANPVAGVSSVFTGPGGEYTLGPVAAGDYELTVGGTGTSWNEETIEVTAIADDTVEADFVVEPRESGTIAGYVLGPGVSALAKICVSAYDESGDIVAGSAMAGSSTEGTWSIEDVEPGDYRLLFWDCDYSRTPAYASTFYGGVGALANATPITLTAGSDVLGVEMNLVLGGTIEGHINVQTPDGVIEFPGGRSMDATAFQLVDGAWEPVPDPSPLVGTGDIGDYEIRGLLPGTYRVGFISPATGPREYATEYYDDVATVGAAENIAIAGTATVDEIHASVAIPRPDGTPFAVATEALDVADEDEIVLDEDVIAQGQLLEVEVGEEFAGEWISIWGHSTPVLMGDWAQVSSTGTVVVPVPAALPAGTHSVVAQDAEGEVIGWVGGVQVTGTGVGVPGTGALGVTGATIALWVVPVAGVVVVLGLAFMLMRRRATEDAPE